MNGEEKIFVDQYFCALKGQHNFILFHLKKIIYIFLILFYFLINSSSPNRLSFSQPILFLLLNDWIGLHLRTVWEEKYHARPVVRGSSQDFETTALEHSNFKLNVELELFSQQELGQPCSWDERHQPGNHQVTTDIYDDHHGANVTVMQSVLVFALVTLLKTRCWCEEMDQHTFPKLGYGRCGFCFV